MCIDFSDNNDKDKEEFTNPISSVEEDTWYDYGTGDPFVMRYNGKYYLYISTRDNQVGIKCFCSTNLVDWEYKGLCAEEAFTKGAYAPEVVYNNGTFYMYTSPAGNGHYVLESKSPVGPFLRITDNLGFSIDGSVFIDDDGRWYFYHASEDGIIAHKMTSPKDIDLESIHVNARMGGWTEGPMVIKVNGKYFLTYTGNHVLSRGYRINYAVGTSPVDFRECLDNPVLIRTMDNPYGIGHSSSVKGPNLDSYYIIYHSLVGRCVEGMPKRVMHIDYIAFNGEKMDVLGPTSSPQQMPQMPDIYCFFDSELDREKWSCKEASLRMTAQGEGGALEIGSGGYVLSMAKLGDNFTIEYNVSSQEKAGYFGGYFHYIDYMHYGRFFIDQAKQCVVVEFMEHVKAQRIDFDLIGSFHEPVDFSVNETFQVKKRGENYWLFFHDRLVGTFQYQMSGGGIGYFAQGCSGVFGFLGGTGSVVGKCACTYQKPIPGTVQGVHFLNCRNMMIQTNLWKNTDMIVSQEEEGEAEYVIRVCQDGSYTFSMQYCAKQTGKFALYVDGKLIVKEKASLFQTEEQDKCETTLLRNILLEKGVHILKICFYGKDIALSEFAFSKFEQVQEMKESQLDIKECYYSDGNWQWEMETLVMADENMPVGKLLYGKDTWGDYTVKGEITFLSEVQEAGFLVRTTNPSIGGPGDDHEAGTYFFQGYYVGIRQGKVVLEKINYGKELLSQASIDCQDNYTIQIAVQGMQISIFLDGVKVMVYEDKEMPFLHGAAGVRTFFCPIKVQSLQIFSNNC